MLTFDTLNTTCMYLFLELKKKNPQICTCAYGFLENTGREPQSKEAAMEE